jgi:hypothetical protein
MISGLMVMILAYWAYNENYGTRTSLGEMRKLHQQMGMLQDRLNMLEDEWAYLNRPDRLRDLAQLNFDRLRLLPLTPEAFGRIGQVEHTNEFLFKISNSIEVSSDNALASTPREGG